MSDKQTFKLIHATARHGAVEAVKRAPDGYVCEVRPAKRSLDQNAALHRAISKIADQFEWHGRKLDLTTWKRLCVAAWLREKGEQPQLVPALDGNGFDVIYEPTSKMTVAQVSELIEWVLAFGAQNGVNFDA